MSQPTANQLAIMRRPNQSTDLYLAVYQPAVVEYGRVFPDAQIQGLPSELADNYYIAGFTATNVFTSGTVRNGMTLVFGSAEGKEDLGRTFVRGKSGTHYDFSVIENMPLVSGIYFRVYDFFELWPVFPRVTVDGSNVITYYKDYDKAYNGQNSNFLPVAVVGPNSAAFVDDTTGQKQMTFVATGSYTIDDTAISNAYWDITRNANILATLTGTTVSYTFPNSGHYTIETRVVNANGLTGTAHRHYVLLNREGIVKSTYNPPLKDWKFEGLDGNWDSGGWQCKFSMGDDSDTVRDGALVIIFGEDVYGGGSPQSFGGYADRENILFSGYIDKVDDKNNWQGSRATFNAKSAINLLQNRDMFSVSLETSPNPVDWSEIKNMTINRIIDHYLRWHSTFLDVCDYCPVKNTGAGDYPEQYEDIPRGEIFNNVRNILSNRVLANFVSDKQGRVFSEVNMNYMLTGSRPGIAITFEEGDWIDQLKTIEDLEYQTSSVLMGGVTYDSSIVTGSAYLSRAPDALFPLHWGKSETKSGLTIDTQSTLNNLSGLYLAANNSRFPSLSMSLANNMRTMDIIPQEFYQLPTDYPFTDRDLRNLKNVWANRRFIPRRMNYSLDEFTLQSEVVYEAETYGPAGETVRIPPQPPTNGTPEAPTIPGLDPNVDPETPPGLGTQDWEVDGITGIIYDVALYGDYVYLCGSETTGNGRWRIEKRNKSDGSLVWGITKAARFLNDDGKAYGLEVNSNGVFVCGYLEDSAFQPSFSPHSFVVIKFNDSDGSEAWIKEVVSGSIVVNYTAYDLQLDDTYIYVVGIQHATSAADWSVLEKRAQSDGSLSFSVDIPGHFTSVGLVSDGSSVYNLNIGNVTDANGSTFERRTIAAGSSTWTETDADLVVGGGILIDGDYLYNSLLDDPDNLFMFQKRSKSNGSLIWDSAGVSANISAGGIGTRRIGLGGYFIHAGIVDGSSNYIYQVRKSDGVVSSAYTLGTAFPNAIVFDGNVGYFGGADGGTWHIEKRTLPYT